MQEKQIKKLLNFSIGVVEECNHISKKYYKRTLHPEFKEDNSPVTIADKKCEKFIISTIKKKYPGHSFLAEESGSQDKNSEFKWIIDPIDGTKNFIRHLPFWGTLLALEYQREVVLGVIALPAMKMIISAGKGLGCYNNKKRVKVSKITSIDKSYFIHGGIEHILKQTYEDKFLELAGKSYYDRGYGDCYAHTLVISGNAEFMIDPYVDACDVAAVKICAEEAGGVMTDLKGNKTIYSEQVLTSNGWLHEKILKFINN